MINVTCVLYEKQDYSIKVRVKLFFSSPPTDSQQLWVHACTSNVGSFPISFHKHSYRLDTSLPLQIYNPKALQHTASQSEETQWETFHTTVCYSYIFHWKWNTEQTLLYHSLWSGCSRTCIAVLLPRMLLVIVSFKRTWDVAWVVAVCTMEWLKRQYYKY